MEPQIILPEELLIEILLRLPVKSLVRFKCVSKSWLSLISDPQFAQSHFDLDYSRNQRLFLIGECAYGLHIRSIDVNAPSFRDHSASSVVKLNFTIPRSCGLLQILGSCRGFILLAYFPNLYIWNPCTGFHTQLPPSPIHGYSSSFASFLFGFGYDPSKDDYLVIVASYYERDGDYSEIRVQCFSSRANAWEELKADRLYGIEARSTAYYHHCLGIYHGFSVGKNFNGAIHWIAERSQGDVIVAFDLKERVFYEISLPNDFHLHCNRCRLRVLGEFLCVCVARNARSELW